VCIELALAHRIPGKFSNHEVDRILHTVDSKRFDAPVVLTGDSVGRQLFETKRLAPEKYACLACSQAVEMAGQYYLIRRYLANNSSPHAVIYLGHPPFGYSLGLVLTENYVQRCFTHWREILGLAVAKRSITFGLRMVLYKLLPSYKYRLHLQEKLTGISRAQMRGGIGNQRRITQGLSRHGLFRLSLAYLENQREMPISDEYFHRLLLLLESRDIHLYYIPPPISSSRHEVWKTAFLPRFTERMKQLERQHRNFHFMQDLLLVYPDTHFCDPAHLFPNRIPGVRAEIQPFLGDVLNKRRPEYVGQQLPTSTSF